jgi:hypothetical protein
MAVQLTAAQQEVLLGSHRMITSAIVLRGTVNLGPIPVISGYVTATLSTRGGRDAFFTTPRTIIDRGLLNPLTDRVVLGTGVRDYLSIGLFTGRVDTVDVDETGLAQIQLLSVGGEALRDDFDVPWAAVTPTSATAEMRAILQDVDPSWGVDFTNATLVPLTGQQVWEYDRGQALDQIASGANLIWQPDRYGSFTIFDNPYLIGPTLASESVITFVDGQDGVLVNVNESKTRHGVFNAITVVMERTDNTAPVRVTVRDLNPLSSTFYGGLFGRQNKVIKNPTTDNPLALASRLLRQSLALRRSWTIRLPHVPILDPGDVFVLWYRNEVTAQVVETTQYGLGAKDSSLITSRELVTIESEGLL